MSLYKIYLMRVSLFFNVILKREEEEAAEAYKAFVESFDESDKGLNRSWVKGGIVNPEKGIIF